MNQRRESFTPRPGRPDRYVNLDRAARESADAYRIAQEDYKAEQDRKTPRVKPGAYRFIFGGTLPCAKCKGTGGNMAEACFYCSGSGVR